ncbi:hypothetical protein GC722_10185 [Auraticoccus sp. F435]|uniref:Uncharacterized protein n=1 Tax=Auraticoccus cholistanensis TaxID=2656650 RepID=A0A6A9UUN9_9ACTN|nr:DUF6350 family protein [Auraticoccus cholistanensis]MVA76388.1 hypothetical protein [Auraticoccus cholistanensis]
MTPPTSTLRDRLPLALSVTEPDRDRRGPDDDHPVVLPWWLAAAGGGVAAGVVGWMVVAALVLLGWLADMAGSMGLALTVATQFWFSVHGGRAELGATTWTVVPLGLTLVQLVVVSGVSQFAARQRADRAGATTATAARVAALVAVGYLVPLVVATTVVGGPEQLARCLAGGLLVAVPSALWGAVRGLGLPVLQHLPWWARPVPPAVGIGLLTMAATGLVLLVCALVVRFDQVRALTSSATPELLSLVVLVLAQLAYLPNLVLWGVSYALGAGFTVGQGSLVSPTVTELGLLPGFPVLGALPAEGLGGWTQWLWLGSGALAGALSALWVVRGHRGARFDLSALVGGLAGVLTGLVVTVVAAASRGSLGTGRLVGLGPRLTELAVMSTTVMGLAGLATGLVVGLLRLRGGAAGRAGWTVPLRRRR